MKEFVRMLCITSVVLLIYSGFIFAYIASAKDTSFDELVLSCSKGDKKAVNNLINKGVDPVGSGEDINQPIYWAIAQNYPQITLSLLNAGVDPNFDWGEKGGTLLSNACQLGYIDIIKVLLENGASINFSGENGYSPLYKAIIYKHNVVVTYLLTQGALLNDKDILALNKIGWFKDINNKATIEAVNKVN